MIIKKAAIEFALEHPAAGLFLDMGLGKTVVSLSVIEELKNNYLEDIKALVIAPKRVAEDTWPNEHVKWEHLKSLKIIKNYGESGRETKSFKKRR